ncbi:MAG: N-acetylmuramoyl-L-alanine amidase [Clostridium sp.]|nr:N-acetylmuramoyl-L-alanine amidase [Clostridium sp.]
MLIKKIKRILLRAFAIGILLFTLTAPIKGFSSNTRILLDLSHSDTMYYSNGQLVRDNGAIYRNYTERELTNQITLKVKTILEENGINVDLTRNFDGSITLEERVEKATKFGYDAYISLHANSCVTPNTGSGYEAYSNNQYTLSKEIIDDLSETFGLPNRGIQATPYYNRLIQNSTLIELGFINNDVDREILVNKQDEVAQIIANNILKQYKPKAETKTIDTNNGSFNILINYK